MLKKILLGASLFVIAWSAHAADPNALLNASYDVSREFYKDYNTLFQAHWKAKTGKDVTINQSHGGSSKQARSVADGLEADVVTLNQATDLDFLAKRKVVAKDWVTKFPNGAAPTTSISVFLVRRGNPKNIRDWNDLIREGVRVVIPNPKTAGNGRYTYLAAWGYVIKKGGSEQDAIDFETKLFKNVPVLDSGGRGATTTFAQRNIGDVLVTFESEVAQITKELGDIGIEVVYPSITVLAENPVAIVDRVVRKHGTQELATEYLNYLYSDEAQELAAKNYLRPRSAAVLAKHAGVFKPINTFTVDEVFGGWANAQKVHFDDGGKFDQIFTAIGKKN